MLAPSANRVLPRSRRPQVLPDGIPVTDAATIHEAFRRGIFYYQYVNLSNRSRVMVCDNKAELSGIATRIRMKQGVEIVPIGWSAEGLALPTKATKAQQCPKDTKPVSTRLNGETLTSAASVRHLAAQGDFLFQLTNPLSDIVACRDKFTIDNIASVASKKRPVIARLL